MKIYNKKNFAYGLLITLLGVALIGMGLAEGWVWKDSVIDFLCLVFGVALLVRSCSRSMSQTDKLAELDERNQLVLLKNRSKAFQIHRYLCLALTALFFVLAAVQGTQMFLYVGIGFAFAFSISLLVDIATFVYYECRT